MKMFLFLIYSRRIVLPTTVGIVYTDDFFSFFQHFKNVFTLSLAFTVYDEMFAIFEIIFAF